MVAFVDEKDQIVEEWRTFLYPLGFLSSLAFGMRFIIQWLQSEKAHKSLVPRTFWKLSLIGNVLLLLHSFIQMQYHVCIVQGWNGVISWRNLNLMQTVKPPISLHKVVGLLFGAFLLISFAFALQDWLFVQHGHWFHVPTAPWQTKESISVSIGWHILGAIGYLLFSSRFWIQWVLSEKKHQSQLPLSFWWLSLCGAFLSLAYFIRIGDSVNLIGPLIGIVPYVRNLMLLKRATAT